LLKDYLIEANIEELGKEEQMRIILYWHFFTLSCFALALSFFACSGDFSRRLMLH